MKSAMMVLLAAVALGGCADRGDDGRGASMEMDSEACRAHAAAGIDAHGVNGAQTEEEKREAYVKAYRDCMAAKGYTLTPDPVD